MKNATKQRHSPNLSFQIVIGYRRNDQPEPPAKAESRSIVIGYTDGDRPVTRYTCGNFATFMQNDVTILLL